MIAPVASTAGSMRGPGRAERITARLDAQYLGRQDHAISPYARCAVVPRRPAAHGGTPALQPSPAPTRPRPPHLTPRTVTIATRPFRRDEMASSIRCFGVRVKRNFIYPKGLNLSKGCRARRHRAANANLHFCNILSTISFTRRRIPTNLIAVLRNRSLAS